MPDTDRIDGAYPSLARERRLQDGAPARVPPYIANKKLSSATRRQAREREKMYLVIQEEDVMYGVSGSIVCAKTTRSEAEKEIKRLKNADLDFVHDLKVVEVGEEPKIDNGYIKPYFSWFYLE